MNIASSLQCAFPERSPRSVASVIFPQQVTPTPRRYRMLRGFLRRDPALEALALQQVQTFELYVPVTRARCAAYRPAGRAGGGPSTWCSQIASGKNC